MSVANYIRALLKRLHSSREEAQLAAAESLWRLARQGAEQQQAIAAAGGVPGLLHLLHGSDSEAVQLAAARALFGLCHGSPSNVQALAAAQGVSILLQCSERIAAAGGMAAMCLGLLCGGSNGHPLLPANIERLAELGGMPALVRLLRSGQAQAQQGAAVILANLGNGPPEHVSAVVDAGCMAALAGVLEGSPDKQVQSVAMAATNNLCKGCPAATRAATAAGTVPTLLLLLCSPTNSSQVKSVAAICLSSIAMGAAEGRAAVMAAGGLDALLNACRDTSDGGVQAGVANALQNLACNSPASKAAITAAGGVQAMVHLLRSSDDAEVRSAAAGMLRNMSDDARDPTQQAFAASGAAATLVSMLGDSSQPAVQEEAVGVLYALAGRRAMHREAMVAAGGIPALLRLLRPHGSDTAQSSAIKALRCLILEGSHRAAVVEAGGMEAFVSCLRSGMPKNQAQAAAALADLTRYNAEFRQPAAALGAIPLLSALVLQQAHVSGGEVKEETALAVVALRCLAKNNRANSLAVTTALGSAPGTPMHESLVEVMFLGTAVETADSALHLPGMIQPPAGVVDGPAAVAAAAQLSRGAAGVHVCARPGCGNTCGLRRCSACSAVRYCGTACATAHWKQHRAECRRLSGAVQHPTAAAEEATPQP